MYEVSKCAPPEALRDLDQAFAHFFRRGKEKKAGKTIKVGFPRFKSKKNGLGSFRLTGAIPVFEKAIQWPRLGVLRRKERGDWPVSGAHILSATVSEKAGRWFVSLQVEIDLPEVAATHQPVAGVDLGINRMAQVSEGISFENPRALKSALTKRKRVQRVVSRRPKGRANRKKALRQLARAHSRVANLRKDALHQATSLLAKTKSAIVLENLNGSEMIKNHPLAQAMAEVGLDEFRRPLVYKGAGYGCEIVLADRFSPSTQRCSHGGQVKPGMGLGEREYPCEHGGFVIDRDLNAAINLEQLLSVS